MRLGQILVAAGRISPAQLDEALRAQVLYGGRLGTNLVELGHIDLDALALALARLHGIPAALLKHFERCDLTVQSLLPPALAAQWQVIPIGHLADRRSRIAIAALRPLPAEAVAAIATALRCTPSDLIIAIAGELRIMYYLERCYGIPRESRYLRIRRATTAGVPLPPPELDEADSEATSVPLAPAAAASEAERDEVDIVFDTIAEESEPAPPPPEPPRTVSLLDFEVTAEAAHQLAMQQQRHFVRTLSDDEAAAPGAADAADAADAGRGTLARIPLRRMAPAREETGEPTTLEEAVRAVRRAVSRDRVGELVAQALVDFSGADVGAVFVIRDPVAIGWKGVVRGGAVALDGVAVALDEPGALLATAHGRDGLAVVDRREASPVDRRLWRALGCGEPTCAVAARVAIGDQPVCLLYVQGERADGARVVVERLADATRIAFTRLLRAAQR
jgi:hypothetical protein